MKGQGKVKGILVAFRKALEEFPPIPTWPTWSASD